MKARHVSLAIAVVATLIFPSSAAASTAVPAVYKMKRDRLHVVMVVKRHRIHFRIWTQEWCSTGGHPAREFEDWDRVSAEGRVRYAYREFDTEYGASESRLKARVTPGAVRGLFLAYDREGYVCATGRPRARLLHFTARRVG